MLKKLINYFKISKTVEVTNQRLKLAGDSLQLRIPIAASPVVGEPPDEASGGVPDPEHGVDHGALPVLLAHPVVLNKPVDIFRVKSNSLVYIMLYFFKYHEKKS